jgi:ariadne-1
LFEDNQANLEQAVEDLSEMLEKPIDAETVPQIRADVTNKTAFVQKRSDIIFQDTLSGHWEVSRLREERSFANVISAL